MAATLVARLARSRHRPDPTCRPGPARLRHRPGLDALGRDGRTDADPEDAEQFGGDVEPEWVIDPRP